MSGGLSGWQRQVGNNVYAAEILRDLVVVLWVCDCLTP